MTSEKVYMLAMWFRGIPYGFQHR